MSTISASTTTTTAYKVIADTTGTLVLQTGSTPTTAMTIATDQKITLARPLQGGSITSATAVASTSGTSIDFTGIPSWAKRITVMFNGVSVSGSSIVQVQLGDSGGVETTGYTASASYSGGDATSTTGFLATALGTATYAISGALIFTNLSGNIWVLNGVNAWTAGTSGASMCSGTKTLSDVLDRVRITTVNGTDAFDAGSINIMYEG